MYGRFLMLTCLVLSTPVFAGECFPPQRLYHQPEAIGIINGVPFLASLPLEYRDQAVNIARRVGGCIEEYGVQIDAMDPVTKVVRKWKRTPGISVWRPVKSGLKEAIA